MRSASTAQSEIHWLRGFGFPLRAFALVVGQRRHSDSRAPRARKPRAELLPTPARSHCHRRAATPVSYQNSGKLRNALQRFQASMLVRDTGAMQWVLAWRASRPLRCFDRRSGGNANLPRGQGVRIRLPGIPPKYSEGKPRFVAPGMDVWKFGVSFGKPFAERKDEVEAALKIYVGQDKKRQRGAFSGGRCASQSMKAQSGRRGRPLPVLIMPPLPRWPSTSPSRSSADARSARRLCSRR